MKETFEVEINNEFYESEVDIFPIYSDWEYGHDDEICPTGDVIDWDIEIMNDFLPSQAKEKLEEVARNWASEYVKY